MIINTKIISIITLIFVLCLCHSCKTEEDIQKNIEPVYGDAIALFNGQNLDNWQLDGTEEQSKWVVGRAALSTMGPPKLVLASDTPQDDVSASLEMINLVSMFGESINIYTKEKFADCRIELEFMLPRGGNSGIYLMGQYEVQVADSWGVDLLNNSTIGAVSNTAPAMNAAKEPGQWQKFIIDFQAPRFDANGQKTANAKFIKIVLNDQVLIENIEQESPTNGALTGREAPTGPLMLQGNHGGVSFRSIIIKPVIE